MKIAVLTRLAHYYTEQRLKEEAEKRGHEVELIRYPACYVSLSGEKAKILYQSEELGDYDVVIPRSFAGMSAYGAAILRQFEVAGAYALVKSIAITRAVDGLRAMQLLAREGVPVPKMVFLREPGQAEALIEEVGLPAVVKVASPLKRGNTVLAETQKAISSVIQAFYVNDATFLLQEYVGGENRQSVQAVVVGSSVVASVRKSNPNLATHRSGQYDKIAVLGEDQKKVAVKAAKALGLTVCVVEMVIAGGRTVVLGVDPYFGIENIETVTKRNVAGKIIDYIELNAKRRGKKDKVGA